MSEAVGIDLSGIGVRIAGAGDDLNTRLREELGPFFAEPPDLPFLDVGVMLAPGPTPTQTFYPKAMRSAFAPGRARFSLPEGSAVVDGAGVARVRMLEGLGRLEYYVLANLVRACLAWMLPSRGGALLHAAGAIIEDRAYLLVGHSGAGKSTWSRLAAEGGARILSDDLVLVDGIGPRPEALGAPFRATFRSPLVKGRWPLAALLFPRHAAEAEVGECSTIVAQARLAANLTFIADAVQQDARIVSLLDRLVADLPCAELAFARDASFVELLRRWP